MKVVYHMFVYGIPKAQPRAKMTMNRHVYTPRSADAWKEEIKSAFRPVLKPTITGPVKLQVSLFLPRPKALKGDQNIPHDKKPDTDNLLKAVMDAMTNAKVWNDDAQVFETHVGKYYAGKRVGAQIIVETF